MSDYVDRLLVLYDELRSDIEERVESFKRCWKEAPDEDLYLEAVFCLLTPQSKALSCWEAVRVLADKGLLFEGDAGEIALVLKGRVRFHNTKAERVVSLRKVFLENRKVRVRKRLLQYEDPFESRRWLVKRVNGYSLKEATHFLRNIGFFLDGAIIDRHILKGMLAAGAIDQLPKSLSYKKYLELEKAFVHLAKRLGLSPVELDLLMWADKTGVVFK